MEIATKTTHKGVYSNLNKLQHVQQQFVIGESTFQTLDSKLAD